jgi:hypothetical protein
LCHILSWILESDCEGGGLKVMLPNASGLNHVSLIISQEILPWQTARLNAAGYEIKRTLLMADGQIYLFATKILGEKSEDKMSTN